MKRTFSSVLFSVLFLVSIFSLQAFSQSRIDGGSGALTSSRHALQAVVSFDLESVTQNTLNTLVAQGNQTLAENGYVQEAYVKMMAEKAGFKFVKASELLANPKDTKDYPKGVWTLPPTFSLGDTDHAKYAAIGESDRMTIKFVKP